MIDWENRICKVCKVNPAPNKKYNGVCPQCRTQLYSFSHGKKCSDCGKLIANRSTRCDKCKSIARRKRVTLTCEWCKQPFEVQEYLGERRFCSRKCRGAHWGTTIPRPKRKEFTCAQCGEVFTKKRSPKMDHYFCSLACWNEWRDKNLKGTNSPHWKPRPKQLICEVCGKEYITKPSETDTAKTCSKECRHKWQSKIMSERNNRMEKPCGICGKTMLVFPGLYEKTKTCGKACQSKWLSQNFSGANSPHYIPDKQPDYGPEFNKALKGAIRKRDGYICQLCGLYTPKAGIRLAVHHIDYDKHNNDPSNLISLCEHCHTRTNFNRDYWKQYFQKVMSR